MRGNEPDPGFGDGGGPNTVLCLDPVPIKRVLSVGMLAVLTILLGYVLLVFPPADPILLVFLGLMTLGAGWLAISTGQSTRRGLELRQDGLFTTDGDCVCQFEEIESVSRGAFAFKPSNGFLLRLNAKGERAWSPGLYWRLGTFVGVGGVTSKAQADVMAETIALALERRRTN